LPLTPLTTEQIAADVAVQAQETPREISSGARQEAEGERDAEHDVR